jgi:RsmE family RNA methyltransferase
VHAPRPFAELLLAEELSACTRLLFCEKAPDPWRLDPGMLSDRVVLCIGPEGGWEASEIAAARAAGYKIFCMGPWTLRAETAAVAAVSILQHRIQLLNTRI